MRNAGWFVVVIMAAAHPVFAEGSAGEIDPSDVSGGGFARAGDPNSGGAGRVRIKVDENIGRSGVDGNRSVSSNSKLHSFSLRSAPGTGR